MVANMTFNPYVQSNAVGSFNISATGYVQGTAMDDPSTRYRLRGGILNTTEVLPMWGGVGIYQYVPGPVTGTPPTNPSFTLGGNVGRATALTGAKALTGFSVFDQAYGMVQTPQSPVPLAGSGSSVNFYPLGSLARVAVKCDPSLISLEGGLITAQVSWDFVSQELVPYAPAYNAVTITGAVWANTAGGQTTFAVGTDLTSTLVAGDDIDVSGVVSTGGTGVGFNGFFTVVSVPDSTHVVVSQPAASSPGTYSSGGTIAAGGGALPVKILYVSPTGNMCVNYDATTGYATWDRNGAAALIQL